MNGPVLDAVRKLLTRGISLQPNLYPNFQNDFDEFEGNYGTYQGDGEAWVHFVRYYVDCWIDSFNHDWMYHHPMNIDDWVPATQLVLELIESNEEYAPPIYKGIRLDQI